MNNNTEKYWYVKGIPYDLTNFCAIHPGGNDQLVTLQGRDCTEMVQSMHSMVSLEKVYPIMEKYRVKDAPPLSNYPDIFTWNDDGIYAALRKRVKNHYESLGSNDTYKSDAKFWVICLLGFALFGYLMSQWVFTGSYVAAFATGHVMVCLGFMMFHAGGHCALSKNPAVNTFWYRLWANYILGFIDKLWDIHHNFAHHGYTNVYKLDPDLSTWATFIRKTEHKKLKAQHRIQQFTTFLVIFFPNQWFGQVLGYFLATSSKKVFGVPLFEKQQDKTPFYRYFAIVSVIVATLIKMHGFQYAFWSSYIFSVGSGLTYWGCVFPNHDTDLSEQSDKIRAKNVDWGEHQIRHTANFKIYDALSYCVGGMNFQIEHHLFPTIHPRHYPTIAKFVQEECKKRDIPYHLHSSWFDALRGHYRHLVAMSKSDKNEAPMSLNSAYMIQNTQ